MDEQTKEKIMKYFKLPKEFATKWLEALRSGEYNQIDGYLIDGYYEDEDQDELVVNNPKGGCCLGIAALICEAQPESLLGAEMPQEIQSYLIPLGYPEELINNRTAEKESLPDILASFNDGYNTIKLSSFEAEYPDCKFPQIEPGKMSVRLSFSEIADWVEQNVELI